MRIQVDPTNFKTIKHVDHIIETFIETFIEVRKVKIGTQNFGTKIILRLMEDSHQQKRWTARYTYAFIRKARNEYKQRRNNGWPKCKDHRRMLDNLRRKIFIRIIYHKIHDNWDTYFSRAHYEFDKGTGTRGQFWFWLCWLKSSQNIIPQFFRLQKGI